MGEYAVRTSDGVEIKIGTCEEMTQCRYDQIKEVTYKNSLLNCFWRLPIPEEDGTLPGEYENSNSWKKSSRCLLEPEFDYDIHDNSGIIQLYTQELGMLVNVSCFHGFKLPENTEETKYFWNGKHFPLRLASLKNTEKEMRICISCVACSHTWSYSFDEIADAILDKEMKSRLFRMCTAYWLEKNQGDCPYHL